MFEVMTKQTIKNHGKKHCRACPKCRPISIDRKAYCDAYEAWIYMADGEGQYCRLAQCVKDEKDQPLKITPPNSLPPVINLYYVNHIKTPEYTLAQALEDFKPDKEA